MVSQKDESSRRLVPVDRDPSWTRGSDADASFGFSFQPFECPLVLLEEWLKPFQALLIMIFEPLLLFFGKHVFFHHTCLDRHTSQPLETEPDIAAKLALRPHAPHA